MPYNNQLGMSTFDPLAAYASGQPAAAEFSRAFEHARDRKESQADEARALLNRQMAMEKMKIRAKELYSHMTPSPENEQLAQRQAFVENIADIAGPKSDLAGHLTTLLDSGLISTIRDKANAAIAQRAEEANDLRRQLAERDSTIKLWELGRKINKDADAAGTAADKADLARQKLEIEKSKLPAGLAEDEALANYREQEGALQKLVESNPGNSGLKQMLRGVQSKIQSWELRHGGQEITVSTPSGETIRVGKAGQQQGALTPPNLTKVQENQAQSLRTIDTANRLEPLIDTETVGAQAFAESWVKDRILAQRFPEMASNKRAKATELAAQLRASAVKELRSDSNITEAERKQILEAVPQINDPVDSPARARRLVRSVRTMSAIQALVSAKRMGTGVPKQAAMVLDEEELATLAEQGMITPQMAQAAWKLKRESPQ